MRDASHDAPHASGPRPRARIGWERFREIVLPTGPEFEPGPLRRLYRLTLYVLRRWLFEDHALATASLLSIDTILSLVPLVGIALFGVSLLDADAGERVLEPVFSHFVPNTQRGHELASDVFAYAQNLKLGTLGPFGVVAAVVLSYFVFASLETAFNHTWRVTRPRNFFVKLTTFYALATFAPLTVVFSLAQPFLAGASEVLSWPFVTTSASLVLLNRVLPSTRVAWSAALLGGGVSALLFELGKVVFGAYVASFADNTYEGLYGSAALVPIFVVWCLISWSLVLLGAQIAFACQHAVSIAAVGFVNSSLHHPVSNSRRDAMRLLIALGSAHARGEAAVSRDDLVQQLGLGYGRVGEILGMLGQVGYVHRSIDLERYSLARAPDKLVLRELLAALDGRQHAPTRDDLDALLLELDAARDKVLGERTLASLCSPAHAPVPSSPE